MLSKGMEDLKKKKKLLNSSYEKWSYKKQLC